MADSFDMRLAENYRTLSNKQKQAADYVAANRFDTATRSLRSVASKSGIPPATFSRLARSIGYSGFEELREMIRVSIGRKVHTFSEKAERLRSEHSNATKTFIDAHMSACIANIQAVAMEIDQDHLKAIVDRLEDARKVVCVGALGSTGIVENLTYMASFLSDNWSIAGRMGASLGTSFADLDERDVVVVVTKPPFASRAIRAAEMAQALGAFVIVITDTHSCPALDYASVSLIVPTDSPHFFSSYTATLFVAETLIGMLASRADEAARKRIKDVEEGNRRLEEIWGA